MPSCVYMAGSNLVLDVCTPSVEMSCCGDGRWRLTCANPLHSSAAERHRANRGSLPSFLVVGFGQ